MPKRTFFRFKKALLFHPEQLHKLFFQKHDRRAARVTNPLRVCEKFKNHLLPHPTDTKSLKRALSYIE